MPERKDSNQTIDELGFEIKKAPNDVMGSNFGRDLRAALVKAEEAGKPFSSVPGYDQALRANIGLPPLPAPAPAPAPERYEGPMIQGGTDQYGNLNGTDAARRAIVNPPQAPTIDADIQRVRDSYNDPKNTKVALSKKPVSTKMGLLASAMPAPTFNPYYDTTQAVGTEGPNPYLTRKP